MSSYNRRSTRNTAAPPTQVTYHQNTGRPAVPTQQPVQQQQQQQQQYQMNKAQYQQQTSLTPQQQVQQQIQQTQQQQVQQQQVQASAVYKNPAVQTPVKPVQPQTPQANLLTPKMEANTPMKTVEATPGQDGEMDAEGGEAKKWQKRPKPQGYKVNKVLKRRRKNARFRKLLTPKNAIMVLNELHPGVAFDSREVVNAFNQTNYIVSFEVEGQQFSGEGTSKGAAKQAAAEAAVKSLILKKIAESKKREEAAEPMDTSENADEGQSEAGDGTTNGKRREFPEDEVPWGSLASFALFRLFNEWESQGTYVPFPAGVIPKMKSAVAAVTPANPIPKAPKKPASMQGTHPVTLVGRLWPGSIFTELSRDGQPPNMTFVMGVTVDGKSFTGTAKNKKDAKKECAKAALAGMGVQWEEQVAQTV